jgi:hypothetical protein
VINGGYGNDIIFPNRNVNVSSGISDGTKDIINCGGGHDEVWISTYDLDIPTSDCEVIHYVGHQIGDVTKSHKMTNLTSYK